ncbi:recombinase family protein [Microbispora sp. SCL1-1]|uniref:recombinase family protein n=1 Tax=unclassified Microbispora TaxID=2614687 RepID=UPI001159E2EB|nr:MULTISPECIES: recombinase family protein [unclassified Microbispora]NJP28079.1 recombinase family protein [Microbispora sp. CL1-1]TQS09438.1 recombinase family protein [Microbispora sp. SCL1-1]
MSTPTPRDYVLYLRKSKGRAGIARQRRDATTHCERLGGRIVAEFVDTDRTAFAKVGAGPSQRDDYQAMLDFLRADTRPLPLGVLAWHADRLHRDPSEAETFLTVCASGHHPVETARSGNYDLTTPTGRKRFRTDVVDAAYEVDHMIERIESMKVEAAREGRWLGGRRPFGYEADGVTVRPAEAAAADQAADQALGGRTLNSIAKEWNASGITTSTGGKWTEVTLRRMLLRPRNAGIMEHRGEEIGRAEWPAIIEETKWRALRALLTDPARRTSPGNARRWLGSGQFECGICEELGERDQHGRPVTVIAGTSGMGGKGDRASVPAYRCSEHKASHVIRNAEHLDKYVSMVAVEWLSQPGAVELFTTSGEDPTAHARAVERETLRAREREAAQMFAAGQITGAQLAEMNATWAARRFELDAADAATARRSALDPFRNGDARQVWEGLDVDRRRAVIAEIMRVVVLPAKRGKPKGWTPEHGKKWGYFDPASIRIERREGEAPAPSPTAG